MFLTIFNSPFSLDNEPVHIKLAENGGDILISNDTRSDGQPDWTDASMADPRGLTDEEWQMCVKFSDALMAAAELGEGL